MARHRPARARGIQCAVEVQHRVARVGCRAGAGTGSVVSDHRPLARRIRRARARERLVWRACRLCPWDRAQDRMERGRPRRDRGVRPEARARFPRRGRGVVALPEGIRPGRARRARTRHCSSAASLPPTVASGWQTIRRRFSSPAHRLRRSPPARVARCCSRAAPQIRWLRSISSGRTAPPRSRSPAPAITRTSRRPARLSRCLNAWPASLADSPWQLQCTAPARNST